MHARLMVVARAASRADMAGAVTHFQARGRACSPMCSVVCAAHEHVPVLAGLGSRLGGRAGRLSWADERGGCCANAKPAAFSAAIGQGQVGPRWQAECGGRGATW